MGIKVRAKELGYYDLKRRRIGDVFELVDKKGHRREGNGKLIPIVIKAEDQFSEKWMERVDDSVPIQSRRPKAFSKSQDLAESQDAGVI